MVGCFNKTLITLLLYELTPMKIYKYLLLLVIFPLLLSVNSHKFYVSVTEVEFVRPQKTVQIISRIFIDDLENALREHYLSTITFDSKNESQEVNTYLERYLQERMAIRINGKLASFKFIGKEYDNDILFCYLEITNIPNIDSFEIINKILFESFEDQQNIIKLNINKQQKSFVLVNENTKAILNF